MPRTAFKMITSGPGTNGSPLSQAGVYQSAVPEPQMRGKKKSLLSHYCGSGSRSLEARGTCLWLVPTKPQLKRFNQPLGSVALGGAKAVLRDKTLERNEDDQRQGCNNGMKCKKNKQTFSVCAAPC